MLNQLNHLAASSSTSTGHQYICRWEWCRKSFTDNAELVRHVKEHVRQSEPVLRRDLNLMKRAEEGIGDSMSMSVGPLMPSIALEGKRIEESMHKPSQEPEPSSSLPSPPISSPAAGSPRRYPKTFERSFTPENISRTPESASPSPMPQDLDMHTPGTPPRQEPAEEPSTPTFMSLSSPVRPETIEPLPQSPSFDQRVESVLKSKQLIFPKSTAQQLLQPSGHSRVSSTSEDSVERQLTQSQPREPSPILNRESPVLSQLQSQASLPLLPLITQPTYSPQAWYQPCPPPRKKARIKGPSPGESGPRGSNTPSQSVISPLDYNRPFQSGVTQVVSQHGSEESSQSSSSSPPSSQDHSYGLFQTQAPYHSQDPFSL